MKPFRCYFIDQSDKAKESAVIEANTASDALRKALQLVYGRPYTGVEVYDGAVLEASASNPAMERATSFSREPSLGGSGHI